MTTISDVFTFISAADEDELDRLIEGIKLRRKFIGQDRAAQLKVGDTVRLAGLSPKALNGLRGTVDSITRSHAAVMLDRDSTLKLLMSRTRFAAAVAAGAETYLLRGIPVTCCVTEEP